MENEAETESGAGEWGMGVEGLGWLVEEIAADETSRNLFQLPLYVGVDTTSPPNYLMYPQIIE